MLDVHADLVAAGADTHKGDPVSVGFVHIGLDLENKGGKAFFHRVNGADVGISGRGRQGHFQEVLQEDLDAEVVEG